MLYLLIYYNEPCFPLWDEANIVNTEIDFFLIFFLKQHLPNVVQASLKLNTVAQADLKITAILPQPPEWLGLQGCTIMSGKMHVF